FTCAAGHDHARSGPARLRHLALDRTAGVVGVTGETATPELRHQREDALARRTVDDEEDVEPRRLHRDPFSFDREQEALDPRTEADTRRRRPAHCFDEAVVAAAAANRRVDILLRP